MKRRTVLSITTAVLLVLSFTITQTLYAQDQQKPVRAKGEGQQTGQQAQQRSELQGPFANYAAIPDLTEKQKSDIKAIRIEMLKDMKVFKDQINEKEAALRTATRADKYDSKVAEKLIDEISALQAENRKRVERARNQIRSMLNEEQKLWFDQNCQDRPAGQKKAGTPVHQKKQPQKRK